MKFPFPKCVLTAVSAVAVIAGCSSSVGPNRAAAADTNTNDGELTADPTTAWPDSSGGTATAFALQIGPDCIVPDAKCQGATVGFGGAALAFNVANAAASCDLTVDAVLAIAVCQVGGFGPEDPIADYCSGAAAYFATTQAKTCVARALSGISGIYSIFVNCYKACPAGGSSTQGTSAPTASGGCGTAAAAGTLSCNYEALTSNYYDVNACVQGGGGAACFTNAYCGAAGDSTCDVGALYDCLCGGGGIACFATGCSAVAATPPTTTSACAGQSTNIGSLVCDFAALTGASEDSVTQCVVGGGGASCFTDPSTGPLCGDSSGGGYTCNLDAIYSCLCGGGGSACFSNDCSQCQNPGCD